MKLNLHLRAYSSLVTNHMWFQTPGCLSATGCMSRCITSLNNGKGAISPQEELQLPNYLWNLIMIPVPKMPREVRNIIGYVPSNKGVLLRFSVRAVSWVWEIWAIVHLKVSNALLLEKKRFSSIWCCHHTFLIFLKLKTWHSLNKGPNLLLHVTIVSLPDRTSVVPELGKTDCDNVWKTSIGPQSWAYWVVLKRSLSFQCSPSH